MGQKDIAIKKRVREEIKEEMQEGIVAVMDGQITSYYYRGREERWCERERERGGRR